MIFSQTIPPPPPPLYSTRTPRWSPCPPLDIHHMESEGEGAHSPDSDWTVLPLDQDCDTIVPNPPWFGKPTTSPPTSKLKKLRLKGKDYKKGGDGLRGKNVIEAYRVKEKDLKRTMK